MYRRINTAIVYCEKEFGKVDGKTAAGLVRHSENYTIVGVIDSALSGKDAGEVLEGPANGIPIFYNLQDALNKLPETPDNYIYGKAPLDTYISNEERVLIIEAMRNGMNIINGLHQFFSDDQEFVSVAAQNSVHIQDIRKSATINDLHVFTGDISRVNVPVIAFLGTDCACGKMTTAMEFHKAIRSNGIRSELIATGQTALMQGLQYGISTDALISQFVVGEIEHAIVQAFDNEDPEIILVEGQSAASHPAFMSSLGILKGSKPDGIILQHPPARRLRCDFPQFPMPTVKSEIELLETISEAKVIAIALSHEDLTGEEISKITRDYEKRFLLPTVDVLTDGCEKLIDALYNNFPELSKKINGTNLKKIPALTTVQMQEVPEKAI
jgi:uncharacterized NAD-dependent epimerase/dehydratase family protein